MIKSVYSSVKMRIRTGEMLSESFDNFLGVKQGEPLSPLLFLFFINDLIEDMDVSTSEHIVNLNGILIYLILFADDTVLFAKSPEKLQEMLNKFYNLDVNHLIINTKSNKMGNCIIKSDGMITIKDTTAH